MPDVMKPKNPRQPGAAADNKTKAPSEDAIRVRAYERYVQRGGEPGREEEDWREAEQELRSRTER